MKKLEEQPAKNAPINDMILHDELFFTRLYKREMELKQIRENLDNNKMRAIPISIKNER